MSHELHYTSVARGLKSGTVGYCTVGATANLPGPLAVRLEGLSGYRAVFPHGHPSAHRNPSVIAHAKLSIAGTTYNVVSMISDAGLDYSERDNKYAHHIAIEPRERPQAGPAWLASTHGLLQREWKGPPRIIENVEPISLNDRPPGVCKVWDDWFHDAGWAGVAAESFLADPNRPVYIVFDLGDDVLSLFVEALALLPKDRRWDVGFSTYYTGQSQGLTCTWRGVLRGSPEEQQARKLPGSILLDRLQSPARAKGGSLVELARTGVAPAERERTAVTTPFRFASPVRVEPAPGVHQIRDEVASSPSKSHKIPAAALAQKPGRPSPSSRPADLELSRRLIFAGIGLAVTLLMTMGAMATWLVYQSKQSNGRVGDTVSRIREQIEHDELKEARKLTNEKSRDPEHIKDAEFARISRVLEEKERADFELALDRAEGIDISILEPKELKDVNDRAFTYEEKQKVRAVVASRRQRRAKSELPGVIRDFESSLDGGQLKKARDIFTKIEALNQQADGDRSIEGLRGKLEEKERAERFQIALQEVEVALTNPMMNPGMTERKRLEALRHAARLAKTPGETRKLERLKLRYFSAWYFGPSKSRSVTRVDPPSRETPPPPPLPMEVARERPLRDERREASDVSVPVLSGGSFTTTPAEKSTWTPRKTRNVKSIRIHGLSATAPARWNISAVIKENAGDVVLHIDAAVNGKRSDLGIFRSHGDTITFESNGWSNIDTREAFLALEGCVLEAQVDSPELSVRKLIKPHPNTKTSRFALAALFLTSPGDIDTEGTPPKPLALKLKFDLAMTKDAPLPRPTEGSLYQGDGVIVKLAPKDPRGGRLVGEYPIKASNKSIPIEVEIKQNNIQDNFTNQLIIFIRQWPSPEFKQHAKQNKAKEPFTFEDFEQALQSLNKEQKEQETRAASPQPNGATPPAGANSQDGGRGNSNSNKEKHSPLLEYLKLLSGGSIELSPAVNTEDNTFYLFKADSIH